MADGARRTDIWITKSLPELSSGETKNKQKTEIKCQWMEVNTLSNTDIFIKSLVINKWKKKTDLNQINLIF